jgi:hypothetical protein
MGIHVDVPMRARLQQGYKALTDVVTDGVRIR